MVNQLFADHPEMQVLGKMEMIRGAHGMESASPAGHFPSLCRSKAQQPKMRFRRERGIEQADFNETDDELAKNIPADLDVKQITVGAAVVYCIPGKFHYEASVTP